MSNSFQGKRTLVTGADGFIGSHLVERLVQMGAEVRAFVYYNSWNQIGWLTDVPEEILNASLIMTGNICDADRVREAVQGCDYVFHLASLIGIPYSYLAPRSYVETNITGTLNILQACREDRSLARLLYISTSEVYGTAQHVPIDEDHPLVGQSPYSATKIGAEKMAESFFLSFGTPVVIVRPFNTFGPRQTARAVIPTIVSQLLSGRGELTLGALHPTRDFNFVTDIVEGMIALALCKKAEGQVVNIGSGEEWSIEQTAKLIMDVTGREVPIRCDQVRLRPGLSEVNRLVADNRKIKTLIGWESRVSFREGIVLTVEWIDHNLQYFDSERFSQ